MSNNNAVVISDEVREFCRFQLEGLIQRLPELQLAVLTTVDGRPLSVLDVPRRHDAQRAAAFVSALLALCESFAREIQFGICQHLTLSMKQGNAVLVRTSDSRGLFVLAIVADSGANLGNVLRAAYDWAEKVGAALDAHLLQTREARELAQSA